MKGTRLYLVCVGIVLVMLVCPVLTAWNEAATLDNGWTACRSLLPCTSSRYWHCERPAPAFPPKCWRVK